MMAETLCGFDDDAYRRAYGASVLRASMSDGLPFERFSLFQDGWVSMNRKTVPIVSLSVSCRPLGLGLNLAAGGKIDRWI